MKNVWTRLPSQCSGSFPALVMGYMGYQGNLLGVAGDTGFCSKHYRYANRIPTAQEKPWKQMRIRYLPNT